MTTPSASVLSTPRLLPIAVPIARGMHAATRGAPSVTAMLLDRAHSSIAAAGLARITHELGTASLVPRLHTTFGDLANTGKYERRSPKAV